MFSNITQEYLKLQDLIEDIACTSDVDAIYNTYAKTYGNDNQYIWNNLCSVCPNLNSTNLADQKELLARLEKRYKHEKHKKKELPIR